jgi:hypothetical protein
MVRRPNPRAGRSETARETHTAAHPPLGRDWTSWRPARRGALLALSLLLFLAWIAFLLAMIWLG